MNLILPSEDNSLIPNDRSPISIAVVGLGYVGLPLAVEFGRKYPTVGFDINTQRINELSQKIDITGELISDEFSLSPQLTFSDSADAISGANVFVVAVPTPVDAFKKPDLKPLLHASRLIGTRLKKGDVVIFESTVYPGCTEEECVPVLEKESGLVYNEDFFCGYSPERINPGDRSRRLTTIRKVTSGSTPAVAGFVDTLYASIIAAGTFPVSSIRVAEASKVLENAQRDVNISFINEMALLFDRLGLDTNEVLDAAATKWNFLPFRPGLVGGHCISVDPYYLLFKAESVGYAPQVLLSGRRINDQMGIFVANKVIKLMIRKGHRIDGSRILVLGVTYKENCPDIRNSKVIDVVRELTEFGAAVDTWDPFADKEEVFSRWNRPVVAPSGFYDAIILTVAHSCFLDLAWLVHRHETTAIYDVKGVLPRDLIDGRL
ncbi:nucleotide sugar dehydrogenase [Siphonobacter aquaeclarae]|uniref:UDP-N-acetyl-D-galactosamine dehydrogenase n=1 Tax=Siphonobacter aquaeclarae TaxID=563176 RepID=A0A1G9NDN3_9BACT|nr:nucleotide sugar dehydrogenase [Siphonobacter aquaeclarae]SDL84441.1 UDP-N-acetyl-D-galactosamine dehydrogenase [Siphonobacter aquaeclarae]